jgi:RIO-like serine/threonine protein kinase
MNSSTGVWRAPSLAGQTERITASNGALKVTNEIDILEVFPRTDVQLPWPVDLAKREVVSEAEDGTRTARIKSEAPRSFPVNLLLDTVADDYSSFSIKF